jgi:hypothetical protein
MRIALLSFALAVGACSSSQPTVDLAGAQKTVYAVKSTYAAALTVAVAYNERPRCTAPKAPIICSDVSVVAKMRMADAVASTAIDNAEATVRAPGASMTVVQAAVAAAQNATSDYAKFVQTYK